MGGCLGKKSLKSGDSYVAPEFTFTPENISGTDIFEMMEKLPESLIVELVKEHPTLAMTQLKFNIYVDSTLAVCARLATCSCADELELCIPVRESSTEEMLQTLFDCLKSGRCVHLNNNQTKIDFSECVKEMKAKAPELKPFSNHAGMYPLHLAVLLNKVQVVRELFPFLLAKRPTPNIWFTSYGDYSIIYLALVHGRKDILSFLMTIIANLERGNNFEFISIHNDILMAIEKDNLLTFMTLKRRIRFIEEDNKKLDSFFELALEHHACHCVEYLFKKQFRYGHSVPECKVREAIKSGNKKFLGVLLRLTKGNLKIKSDICLYFTHEIFGNNLKAIRAVLSFSKLLPELRSYTYNGYSCLYWARELDLLDIANVLSSSWFRFTVHRSNFGRIPPIITIIQQRNDYVYDNVKALIKNGHKVSTWQQCGGNYSNEPFAEALRFKNYDVMRILLINGVTPFIMEPFLNKISQLEYMEYRDLCHLFYVLLTCNALHSVKCNVESTFLKFFFRELVSLSQRGKFRSVTSFEEAKNILLLFLNACDCFCQEDETFLYEVKIGVSRFSNFLRDNVILNKIQEVTEQPRSLVDLSRFRIRRHYGSSYQSFISCLRENKAPHLLLKLLLYSDLLQEYLGIDDVFGENLYKYGPIDN